MCTCPNQLQPHDARAGVCPDPACLLVDPADPGQDTGDPGEPAEQEWVDLGDLEGSDLVHDTYYGMDLDEALEIWRDTGGEA